MPKPVIRRFFADPCVLERVGHDFKRLITAINNSRDEYTLQLRENSFNVYFKGNSLASVSPSTGGRYTVRIHRKFLEGVCSDLSRYCFGEPYAGRDKKAAVIRFFVEAESLPRFFQKKHLTAIARNIEKIPSKEELTFEQMLMTDNPPTPKMIIIDRQVADHAHGWGRQIDLLAVARDSGSGPFHFVVIEVKTGRNPELKKDVGKQLDEYIGHVEDNMTDYVDCYTRNYSQKRRLGLFDNELPETIEISGPVKGLVVTGGYSRIATEAIDQLQSHYEIEVQRMDNLIRPMRARRVSRKHPG